MPSLENIPVRVEPSNPGDMGNALPLLNEIRHALVRLAETGERTLIDLLAMPFGPQDESRLFELLGTGEVEASIEAFGPTRIKETGFAGVWLVEHRDEAGRRLVLHIEVATTPAILCAQPEDIAEAITRLDASIQAASP